MKDRTRAKINANPISELGWVGAAISVAIGTLGALLSDIWIPGSDWSPGVWTGGWVLAGAVGGRLLKLRPLTIGLSLAAAGQIVYLVLFADHGDGDGLWAVGLFTIPVGALFAYGAATVVAIARRRAAGKGARHSSS